MGLAPSPRLGTGRSPKHANGLSGARPFGAVGLSDRCLQPPWYRLSSLTDSLAPAIAPRRRSPNARYLKPLDTFLSTHGMRFDAP